MCRLDTTHTVLLALEMRDEMVHAAEAFALNPAGAEADRTEVLGGSDGVVDLV